MMSGVSEPGSSSVAKLLYGPGDAMSKNRILALLLLLALAVSAQDKALVRFRLKKDPDAPVAGWLIDRSQEGFRYEAFGGGKKAFVRWDELVLEDSTRLRRELGLEMSEDEKFGLMDGHELFFKGGGSVRGQIVRREEEAGRILFKTGGLVLPYPANRVDHIAAIKIKESDVFSEDEVYVRRLQRRPPENAMEHRALAEYMYDVGHWKKADEHYRRAIELQPSMNGEIEERLAEIKDLMEDEFAAGIFREAKSLANLQGEYGAAILAVELYIAKNPGAKRRGLRVIDQINERRQQKMQALFQRVKHESFHRAVDRYIARRQPDIQEAMSWATSELKTDLEERVRRKMSLDHEEYELLSEAKPKGAPHFATYWSGSFVISARAKKGKSSRKNIRGDPDSWWDKYHDTKTRSTWLKAYAAERLPDLFEIVQVRITPCERCGGKGAVKKTSLKGLQALNGGHEWFETCPRCFGAREDRGLAYR
jgi:tetratricopeptide (TPR) repeat protein